MIFRETITAALKDRIARDMGFELAAGWEKVPLGQFYFSSDPKVSEIVVERVVGEVLDGILSAHGRIISNAAWTNLFSGIDPTTTPENAAGKMLAAASTSIPKPHSTPFFLGAAAAMRTARRDEVEKPGGRGRSRSAAKKTAGRTTSRRGKKGPAKSES